MTSETEEDEVAESKRRAKDADDVLDDAADVGDVDDRDAESDADDDEKGRGGTKTKAAPDKSDKSDKLDKVKTKDKAGRFNPFSFLVRFVREVVAELRKVIWPTRKELLTYTAVVIVFVAAMLTIVGLLDVGFAKAVLYVFGNPKK